MNRSGLGSAPYAGASVRRVLTAFGVGFALAHAPGCGAEPSRRLGDVCTVDAECASGACNAGRCLAVAARRAIERAWTRTIGGPGTHFGQDVAIGADGAVWLVGQTDGADLDPTDGVDVHAAGRGNAGFVVHLDATGAFRWARSWGFGGTPPDGVSYGVGASAYGVALGEGGVAYVTGTVGAQTDLDPGSADVTPPGLGTHGHVSAFAPDGTLLWARAWGGDISGQYLWAGPVAVAGSTLVVLGAFEGEVDFSAGFGAPDVRQPVGMQDGALSAFTTDGAYGWAWTWGGLYDTDHGEALDARGDTVAVGGSYGEGTDFDPGPAVDALAGLDFVSAFGTDGSYRWTRVWQASLWPRAAVGDDGAVYVAGMLCGERDLDPGPGVALHKSPCPQGRLGALLVKLDAVGGFVWARSWEGAFSNAPAIAWGPSGLALAGVFRGPADLDPSPGTDVHEGHGFFVAVVDFEGRYLGGASWGGETAALDADVAVAWGPGDTLAVTGAFGGTVDFAPGAEVDERTAVGEWDVFVTRLALSPAAAQP